MTSLLVAGLTLAGTATANAQSSSFFGGLSSSATESSPVSYDEDRATLKALTIAAWEKDGRVLDPEAAEIAQQVADGLAAGQTLESLEGLRGEGGGAFIVATVPNILLKSEIDERTVMPNGAWIYAWENFGVGVAGNEVNTYVVVHDTKAS